MDHDEVEKWLLDAKKTTQTVLNLANDWWPITSGDEQARASAWALAFFLTAANARCSAPTLIAACSASEASKPHNSKVLKALWTKPGREHQEEQVLVDFSVHNWDASNPIQMTGESEANASQRTDDQLSPNSYGWDFYKLLLVPSASRLFFARVGGDGGVSAGERCKLLAKTLIELVDWYAPALLRPHDEVGVVIVPSAKNSLEDGFVLTLERGRLRPSALSEQTRRSLVGQS